ncbi:unnamed protein product [Meganyctiphanes norvegica]|uniref:Uncharacterized protein n=1 Tax=Meganyctiphanes norvegica TaxID=48144 RepID=A0AAV2R3H3_MEGNR
MLPFVKMKLPDSCCGCINLRHGSMVLSIMRIGYAVAFWVVFGYINSAYDLPELLNRKIHEFELDAPESRKWGYMKYSALAIIWVSLAASVLEFIINVINFIGVFKDNTSLMKPNFYWSIVSGLIYGLLFAICLVFFLYNMVNGSRRGLPTLFLLVAIHAFYVFMDLYAIFITKAFLTQYI